MPGRCSFRSVSAAGREFLKAAAVINGVNTAINTEGDIVTRFICGVFEAGATYVSGFTANNWTGERVALETTAAQINLGNAGVGYTVGQTAELAAVGLSAAVSSKSSTTTSKNVNPIKPKIRTTSTSSVKNVTVVSGRKKVTSKIKRSVSRNKKFQRVCMA